MKLGKFKSAADRYELALKKLLIATHDDVFIWKIRPSFKQEDIDYGLLSEQEIEHLKDIVLLRATIHSNLSLCYFKNLDKNIKFRQFVADNSTRCLDLVDSLSGDQFSKVEIDEKVLENLVQKNSFRRANIYLLEQKYDEAMEDAKVSKEEKLIKKIKSAVQEYDKSMANRLQKFF